MLDCSLKPLRHSGKIVGETNCRDVEVREFICTLFCHYSCIGSLIEIDLNLQFAKLSKKLAPVSLAKDVVIPKDHSLVVRMNQVCDRAVRSNLKRLSLKLRHRAEVAFANATTVAEHDRCGAIAVPLRHQIVVRHQIFRFAREADSHFMSAALASVVRHQRGVDAAERNLRARKQRAIKSD